MPDILFLNDGTIIDELETGIDYLATLVVDNILNTLMTDLYSPDFGTDLKHMPRYNVDSKPEFMMKLMLTVERIQNRIITEQASNPSIPEEMLARIQITDLYESDDASNPKWQLFLRVFSQTGDQKDIDANINKILKL